MLRKLKRKLKKNPLDLLLKKAQKKNQKTFLLVWNRALGDLSLGLFALVFRIRLFINDAKIIFLIREDLKDAFKLLDGIDFVTVNFFRRYLPFDLSHTLKLINREDLLKSDVIIDKVDPNYWVKWQKSTLIPKLKWENKFDLLSDTFKLPKNKILIALQTTIETKHSPWRQYPKERFISLIKNAHPDIVFVLFGIEKTDDYNFSNVYDLRGKTTLIQALSIIKNRCLYFITLDSGLLSLFYYLNVNFPIKLIALWGSKKVGVINQNVKSPNIKLFYNPVLPKEGLRNYSEKQLQKKIYPYDIVHILNQNDQKKLLEKFLKISIEEKIDLAKEIFSLDMNNLKKQKKNFFEKERKNHLDHKPLTKALHKTKTDFIKGQKTIKQNKVALIILAAGQGSRLGFDGPKALFKIGDKTLLQTLLDKVKVKQKTLNVKLYISIMTSKDNHLKILNYLEENDYFGFSKDQIDLFQQSYLPYVDEDFSYIEKDNKLQTASDGNGSIFESFLKTNIFFKYSFKKIKYLSICPIDNPLLEPFDESFIGSHVKNKNNVTIKCLKRLSPLEKQGALIIYNNKIKILEYIHLDPKKNYFFSNTGIYLMNLFDFKKINSNRLNYYFVKKRTSPFENSYAYKAEKFIFDAFEDLKKVNVYLDDKKNYLPIKDKNSLNSFLKLNNIGLDKLNMLK
jgi:UDP-N-acetylglucosamine/UDP-N-acetylgalactosamine diphosphorylase